VTGPRAGDGRTVWRLHAIAGWGGGLDVTVAVDTTAPAVVDAIERAARDNGIALERVAGEPEQDTP
jgi:hypothetical protein